MPLEMECPGCKWKGPVPETALGKKLRCPMCKNEFRVEAPPRPPLAEDELEIVQDDPPKKGLDELVLVEDDKDARLQTIGITFGFILRNSDPTVKGTLALLAIAFLITVACVIVMVFVYNRLLQTARTEFGETA